MFGRSKTGAPPMDLPVTPPPPPPAHNRNLKNTDDVCGTLKRGGGKSELPTSINTKSTDIVDTQI